MNNSIRIREPHCDVVPRRMSLAKRSGHSNTHGQSKPPSESDKSERAQYVPGRSDLDSDTSCEFISLSVSIGRITLFCPVSD